MARPANYELCPVCWWEDDGGEPWEYSGPNGESLVEAQQRYLAQDLPHRLRPGKVRAPRPGEEREPDWRPVEVTDEVLSRVQQARDDWDRSFPAGTEGMDEQVDDKLQMYNEAQQRLRAEAASLSHGEVKSRLRHASQTCGFSFSEAHLELFARLAKNEDYYRGHPLRTAWWLLRYYRPSTFARRKQEVRAGTAYFAG